MFPNTWACIRDLWGENHIIESLLQLENEGKEEIERVIW